MTNPARNLLVLEALAISCLATVNVNAHVVAVDVSQLKAEVEDLQRPADTGQYGTVGI